MMLQSHWVEKRTPHQSVLKVYANSTYQNCLHQNRIFDEEYDSDGDRVPWCDVIGIEGEQDYDEDEIPKIEVEGVIEEDDVNVSEACPVDTDSANKEAEDPPTLPVDNHISIE